MKQMKRPFHRAFEHSFPWQWLKHKYKIALRVRSAYEMCAMQNADKKLVRRPNYEQRAICIDLEHDFVCVCVCIPDCTKTSTKYRNIDSAR